MSLQQRLGNTDHPVGRGHKRYLALRKIRSGKCPAVDRPMESHHQFDGADNDYSHTGTQDEVKSRYNLDSLTSLGSSSAPLLTQTKDDALKFFKNVRFSEGYGSTETGALTTLRHKDMERKIRSIGKPNPGIEIKLVDEEGSIVSEPYKHGVLWAKARSAFIGYYKDPEKTKQSIDGDWASAGDVAYFDEEGYYFLSDRKHDMIISGGENVYPAEIEEVIAKLPQVSEVAVIGVPHPSWGEEVKAIIKLKEGATVSPTRHHRLLQGKSRRLQTPAHGRVCRRLSAHCHRQDIETDFKETLLGGPGKEHIAETKMGTKVSTLQQEEPVPMILQDPGALSQTRSCLWDAQCPLVPVRGESYALLGGSVPWIVHR